MSDTTTIGDSRVVAVRLAGFWRRLGALLLDTILLGIVGWAIATGLRGWLTGLGPLAHFIGLPIALLYFGLFNSRLGGGGTPGKHALGIAVVTRAGAMIGIARSLWRALVYTVPFAFNGFDLSGLPLSHAELLVATGFEFVLVSGVVFGTFYLYLANWRTRQVVHDLAAGTFVVRRASEGAAIDRHINRVHLVVLALLFLLPLAAIPAGFGGLQTYLMDTLQRTTGADFPGMARVRDAVLADPDAASASVNSSTTTVTLAGGPTTVTRSLVVTVVHRGEMPQPEAYADAIAARVLKAAPTALGNPNLTIVVRDGFDIGIWSGWSNFSYSYTLEKWRQRLAAKPAVP